MAKKTEAKEKKTYRVLIACGNGKKEFEPGDVVTADDFPAAVIRNWLEITPPVLEAENGSD